MKFKRNEDNKLLITPASGYTPHMGVLVSTLQRCRETTIGLIENLSVYQLDYLFDDQDNSIGALLLHIASLDVAYSEITFRGATRWMCQIWLPNGRCLCIWMSQPANRCAATQPATTSKKWRPCAITC